jgi:tetratricopeptide (TPR) repeat protein
MKIVILPFFLIAFIVNGQNAIDYYNKANVQLQYQNYAEAATLLSSAIAAKNDFADAYSMRGDCNYYLKNYDKAIADYEKDMTMKNARSSYNLACTYALSGKKDLAFKALEANLASEYKQPKRQLLNDGDLVSLRSDARWEPLINKEWYSPYELAVIDADAKMSDNDADGARQGYAKAISIDGSKARAYGSRAVLSIRAENFALSLEDLNTAIEKEPKSVYYGNRGYVNSKLGLSSQALEDYEKAVQLDPTNLVYYDLAIARYSDGNKTGALEAIRKHTAYFSKDEMGFYFGGIIASETDQFSDAISYFDQAIAVNNTISQFYMKRGDAYFLMKNYQQAVSDYNQVVTMDPNNGGAYYIRGNAKASLLDRNGACEDWKKAESLGFEDSNGYIRDLCK